MICEKRIATIKREEQIAMYQYLVHFELIGKPGDHPELGEHSSSNIQFVKIYLLLNSSR